MKKLFVVFVVSITALWAGQPNIAVLDFSPSEGIRPSELQMIADRMETELIRTNSFNVLERRNIGAILQEQGLQQSGVCNDAECQVKVGQLLGVDKILTGSLGKVGQVYTLNMKIIDVTTGKIERSHAVDAEGELSTVLTQSCQEMADRFTMNDSLFNAKHPVKKAKEKNKTLWWVGGSVLATAALGTTLFIILDPGTKTPSTVVKNARVIP